MEPVLIGTMNGHSLWNTRYIATIFIPIFRDFHADFIDIKISKKKVKQIHKK